MILLPIGRDNAVIQRHAWVTYGIVALYLTVFMIVAVRNAGEERGYIEDVRAIELVLAKYPYLDLPKQLEVIVGKEKYAQLSVHSIPRAARIVRAQDSDAQKRLDDLVVSAVDHYRSLGQLKYAYVPAESSILKVLLSMWVQFSFLAFIGDAFVLFSTAPYLEDVFGRPAFAMLYFAGAFSSAVLYGANTPNPKVGMFGASGAVSAVVGAFLVRFFTARLEFFFIPFLWRPQHRFRFFVPAWVVIPLWAALQLWLATKQYGGAAIANLGGFAFGAFFAGGLMIAKYEQKHVAPAVAKQTTWVLNEHLTRAIETDDPNERERAVAAFFPMKPANDEELQTALDLIRELVSGSSSPQFCAQAAAFADRNRDYDMATIAYDRACQLDPAGANTIRHLLRLGTLKKQSGDVIGARTALMRAKSHSACSAEVRANIDARLAQLQA